MERREQMFLDDSEPAKKKPAPKNLDPMSVDDLREYIAELEAEIERARAQIAKKETQRLAAGAFFKTPNGSGP
jgi:uncharacterized small protein (DUF1192 family)